MKISYDPAKRADTLAARGLDFEDAPKLFGGRPKTVVDDRFEYGEVRWLSYGWIDDVAIAVVWTEREGSRRIISMRRMHQEETKNVGMD